MLTTDETLWLLRALRKIGFFWVCSVEQVKQIVTLFIKKEFEKGQQIIKQGDKGDFFFIIGTGKVTVIAEEAGNKKKIKDLTRRAI